MTALLTRAEYAAIAAEQSLPEAPFVDGRFHAGSGTPLPVLNPATGETLCTVAAAGDEDIELAVSRAREAFEQGVWSKRHPSERKDVLIRLAKLMTRRRRELAVLESLDAGKPIRDCETVDIPEAITTIKWHAEAIDKIYDQVGPSGDDALSLIVREPVGVVAAILPWNFPLLMLAW
ncbi:MAG: aldehyde dehydrogenase family protein, partial [Pseudomonadota bacterium]